MASVYHYSPIEYPLPYAQIKGKKVRKNKVIEILNQSMVGFKYACEPVLVRPITHLDIMAPMYKPGPITLTLQFAEYNDTACVSEIAADWFDSDIKSSLYHYIIEVLPETGVGTGEPYCHTKYNNVIPLDWVITSRDQCTFTDVIFAADSSDSDYRVKQKCKRLYLAVQRKLESLGVNQHDSITSRLKKGIS